MDKPKILINPVIRWAIEPGHQGSIRYMDDVWLADGPTRIPEVGDVLTKKFMVDPNTGAPCAVRVTQVLYQYLPLQTVVTPVVVRAQQD